MPQFSISEVAATVGLRPSAIRYYEQIGILPPAVRVAGQRRYDSTVLYRLAVIQRARRVGFTLDQIRRLFFGFRANTPASVRWKKLSRKKLAELDVMADQIKSMRRLLIKLMQDCRCHALEECGKGMLRNACGEPVARSSPLRKILKIC